MNKNSIPYGSPVFGCVQDWINFVDNPREESTIESLSYSISCVHALLNGGGLDDDLTVSHHL